MREASQLACTPNDLTEPTIRGVDAFYGIFCVVSLFLAFQTRRLATFLKATSVHATRRQVRLSGHSDWVFGLVCLLGRSLPSLESCCFKKAAGHIRFLDVVLLSAHGRLSLRQVVYAITAACSVLLDEPSSTIGWTTIPALFGSQSVLFFNIAHATTRILRASAMAAFFLRVFWPP